MSRFIVLLSATRSTIGRVLSAIRYKLFAVSQGASPIPLGSRPLAAWSSPFLTSQQPHYSLAHDSTERRAEIEGLPTLYAAA